uniref:Nodulation protein NodO n=1 Tax=Rhizobium leguminosarum TaxID=384 RepID=A0A179B8N9_RHILE|nr:calcium-binding protein [Rhizobium leguminosarum]OAP88038.1 nodulation protein NodO [Rhizobium leguminosarum]
MNIKGSDNGDFIWGSEYNDTIDGGKNNDWINAGGGDDLIRAGPGHDRILPGPGHDIVWAGPGSDAVHAGDDDDLVYSDALPLSNPFEERRVIPHSGESDDRLHGDNGRDTLVAGDGLDEMTGGKDGDAFVFRFHDPMVGTTHCYTTVKDFEPEHDRFVLGAARDKGEGGLFGANFVNHSRGFPGEAVDTFYNGAAADAHGEHVVVITDRGFASGAAAAKAIDHEAAGDIIVYHDEKTHGATLAYVDSANHAHAFAHAFADANNLKEVLDLTSLTASNFVFF